ncbi:hypothetical protein HBB16_03295 [Pseudonocardia sp. MCCB 268]|nr:hypothetical protein [Pseudonocardia cytotoxica]
MYTPGRTPPAITASGGADPVQLVVFERGAGETGAQQSAGTPSPVRVWGWSLRHPSLILTGGHGAFARHRPLPRTPWMCLAHRCGTGRDRRLPWSA